MQAHRMQGCQMSRTARDVGMPGTIEITESMHREKERGGSQWKIHLICHALLCRKLTCLGHYFVRKYFNSAFKMSCYFTKMKFRE